MWKSCRSSLKENFLENWKMFSFTFRFYWVSKTIFFLPFVKRFNKGSRWQKADLIASLRRRRHLCFWIESPTTISQIVLAITSNSCVLNVKFLQETVEGIHPNNHDGAKPNVLLGRCETVLAKWVSVTRCVKLPISLESHWHTGHTWHVH